MTLLFLVPALFMFAVSLVFIRFFPYVMSFLAWLVQRLGSVPTVLAMRHLLVCRFHPAAAAADLTLSLAAFTGSMAQTLDQHHTDSAYYRWVAT